MSTLPPLRYDPDEITMPEGLSVKDLDWTAFAWELSRRTGSGVAVAQIVMVPGVVITRTAVGSDDPTVSFRIRPQEHWFAGTVGYSQMATEIFLREGYLWTCYPFVFDVEKRPSWPRKRNPQEIAGVRHDSSVLTLGDAVDTEGMVVAEEVLAVMLDHRRKKVYASKMW